MAYDLSLSPNSGIITQLCGDAHVRNLGAFEGLDGRLTFDISDFDETPSRPHSSGRQAPWPPASSSRLGRRVPRLPNATKPAHIPRKLPPHHPSPRQDARPRRRSLPGPPPSRRPLHGHHLRHRRALHPRPQPRSLTQPRPSAATPKQSKALSKAKSKPPSKQSVDPANPPLLPENSARIFKSTPPALNPVTGSTAQSRP